MTPTKKAATGVAVALAGATATAAYITNDGGGSVYDYVRKYDQLYQSKTPVVISGACYSSCTMGLGYPNVCLAPGTTLGFHPAYVPYFFGLFHYSIDPRATEEMRRHYPPDALAIVNRQGGLVDKGGWLRPEITLIKGSDFPANYQCKR